MCVNNKDRNKTMTRYLFKQKKTGTVPVFIKYYSHSIVAGGFELIS